LTIVDDVEVLAVAATSRDHIVAASMFDEYT
jgi:hypothetical protein